ncbi:aminotransferase class III-fold pyridoxal phosphate-dependent enzyme [Nocardia sp. CDC159]|uniref:Diaminobutyrate--2-oxoglutarate transaminase n=1 Tax=Nocardia pulmonis TaxID=2951408 RepID=A0A9X2E6H7_9NOCA|nr:MULTISPECIES: aminotransferase class III-fold pyridoxal phosphate-dependent enzyme [Nocardia]MCM6772531.1 aminotransferase class III-fold pyridoxal phosphate-dependent enzyme [Nocardia pulmonis]MCM6784811.1 aminotransferase class III-fold pyridoxal phosphate-dependent enzyme [Nocardia sp. CDC159]
MTQVRAHESRETTYSRRLPIVPVEARGTRVRGSDGRWYRDCLAAAGAMSLGWNHPVVTEAVRRTLDSGEPLLSLDFHTPARDAFVEALLPALPPGLARDCVIHLCAPSGANAIEAALTVAEIATGGRAHVAVQGGFHGCSRAARSVSSGGGLRHSRVVLGPEVRFLPFPQPYRCPFGVGGEAGVDLAVRAVDNTFTDPHSGLADPASIVSEFVLGEGGVHPAPPRWARALRRAADTAGVPLIADEIQAGMYRTGRAWAFEHCGVEPDMIAISKGLGSGIPMAVLVIRRGFDAWEPGVFTGTFRGNALAFAAATAVLRYAAEHRLGDHVRAVGARLEAGLRAVAATATVIGEVRTAGLMAGVEIIDPLLPADERGIGAPGTALAARIQSACLDAGLIVETGGRHGNVIRFLPPLIIDAEEIAAVVEIFADAVQRVQRAHAASPVGVA